MSRIEYHLVTTEEMIKTLQAYIRDKQGRIKKGDFSKYVNKAIKDLISRDKQQQHTTYDQHAMSKEEEMIITLTDLMKDISSYFWKLETPFPFRAGLPVSIKTLKHAIAHVRGSDYRTTKKWFNRFLEYGFISKIRNREVRILNDGHESYDVNPKPEPKKEVSTDQKQREFDSTIERLE